jgi:hypothetical protein
MKTQVSSAVARRTAAVVVAVGALLLLTAASAAAVKPPAAAAGAVLPHVVCASLTAQDLTGVRDAPSRVASAKDVTRNNLPYCDVTGYISPQTAFEMLLPEQTWHGDYLQEGCGGFCGLVGLSLQPQVSTDCVPVSNGELVLATDDQGHQAASGTDGVWAANDPALRVVFGYGSEHSLAQVAKAVMTAYYGQEPAHSYFDGCSDGGHEALDVVQRYPGDFNGVIAGAPANNWSALLGVFESWAARVNMDSAGHQILSTAKLPALHTAVMKACANAQGVIEDPRTCTFDPRTIACPTGVDDNGCLTPAQVTVVRGEYRGPTDQRGDNLFDGGEPYGSELAWTWMLGAASDPNAPGDTAAGQFGLNYLKYMAYWNNPPASFTLRDFSYTDAAAHQLDALGGIYNANDPDLSAFRDHGGKLIIYHGWADQAIPPFATVDYYAAVERQMGGFANTQQFSRLYMVPGGYHCLGGGDPGVSADFLTPLINWVEQGDPPGAIALPVVNQTMGTKMTSLTVHPFDALTPAPHNHGLNSDYHYTALNTAYRPGSQLVCRQEGMTLVCARRRD